eukprot:jgi/Psemu1/3257/gm1.3257_g
MTSIATHSSDCESSPLEEGFDHKSTSHSESHGGNHNDISESASRELLSIKNWDCTRTENGGSGSEKKRRIEQMSSAGLSRTSSVLSWQDFSRKGVQFKTLLDDALAKIASVSSGTTVDPSKSQSKPNRQLQRPPLQEGRKNGFIDGGSNPSNAGNHILQKMVREKQTECLLLQQKVDSQQSEITQLEAIVDDLRESKKQQASNETRLRMALKRASQNATQARNEANEAEANAATLAEKIEHLEKVVQETKRSSLLLLKEQEEIGTGLERMEREFVQAQADLAHSNATKRKMQQEQRKLNQRLRQMKDRLDEVQDELEHERSGKLFMKRKCDELDATVETIQVRSDKLQDELDSAQTLLVDSTSAAAESRNALEDCKQALDRMEEANQHLHQQLQEHQSTIRKAKTSHQEELTRTQKDFQEIQIQLNKEKELFQNLKMEKLAADKRQESQAAKIFALERRLKQSTNLMETNVTFTSVTQNDNTMASTNTSADVLDDATEDVENSIRQYSSSARNRFSIPRLGADSSGLMKKCECGRKDCKVRAHASCARRIYIGKSTPGTPTPARVPVILCGSSGNKTPSSKAVPAHHAAAITPR